MMAPMSNLHWGDLDDTDADDVDLFPPVVEGPDENGVKRVIEFKLDDNGNKVKVTTTTRVCKVSKNAAERRSWIKFGSAADDKPGSGTTLVSTEEVFLERPRAPGGGKTEETMFKVSPSPIMMCRTCGKKGDHWTARCPYQNLATQPEGMDEPLALNTDAKGGAYVPPGKRGGAIRTNKWQNDDGSVRVTNLSEDTSELDLRELFSYFGPVTRVRVPLSKETGKYRGLGFVNFVNKEDAERAIAKLNGYGYDNLIIGVEWDRSGPN